MGKAKRCPRCDIEVHGKFSRTCGARLKLLPPPERCNICGEEVSEYDRYCRECGTLIIEKGGRGN